MAKKWIALFLACAVFILPGALAQAGDWEDVENCYKSTHGECLGLKSLSMSPKKKLACTKRASKRFPRCANRAARGLELKEGHDFKDVARSIKTVNEVAVDVSRKCFQTHKTELNALLGFEYNNIGQLPEELRKPVDDKFDQCRETASKMTRKAMEAQIKQHFQ